MNDHVHQPMLPLSRRRFATGLACGCGMGLLSGCVETNRATGRTSFTGLLSPEDDAALGKQEHGKMVEAFGGVYDDPRLGGYVASIGGRLAQFAEYQQFTYHFTVLNSPIVNAFALPGGFVYLSRGLLALASNEAEMAGVLAHEIGHVNARHTAERISAQQLAQFGLIGASLLGVDANLLKIGQNIAGIAIQSYSREQELEADLLGVRYMSQAGYDPEAMVTFLSTLREHSMLEARMMGLPPGQVDEYNVMATHPRAIDRVRQAQQAANVQRPAQPILAREPYLASIDGILFGDDPKQGVVLDNRFVHPDLRIEFTVPQSFTIRNSPDKVVATGPGKSGIVFDMVQDRRSRDLAGYLQNEWAAKLQLRGVERLDVNGREAATGVARGRGSAGEVDVRFVAIAGKAREVFRFIFITPVRETAGLAEDLQRTTYSFRSISAEEAARVHGLRLLIVPAGPQDSVQSLARTLPFGPLNEDWFRVLNDMKPGEPLQPQQKVKVVAA